MTAFELRPREPLLIGAIHLLPLPGSPSASPGLNGVVERAVRDAIAMVHGGADAAIVENHGDAPFSAGPVAPYTIAAMTRVALAVREAAPDLTLGINVLRNDANGALAVATAVGARFVRVNVHTGTMWTDQGPITGQARATLLERNRLGSDVAVAADVQVKHATPPTPQPIADSARDCWRRGRADVLIVSGTGTGERTSARDLAKVRAAVPDAPIWVGSGFTPAQAGQYPEADGFIVGTWLHEDGVLDRPVDAQRVRAIKDALLKR